MKIGDLVQSKGFMFHNYGVGIIIGKKSGGLRIYWPEQGFWSITSEGGVEPL